MRLSPSETFWKSICSVESATELWSTTNAAGAGTASSAVQLGPRAPMKDVLPKSALPSTVKLRAEDIAMAYPNAPVSRLFSTVPESLTLLPYSLPNQVRGPMAMPILAATEVSTCAWNSGRWRART